MDIYDSKIQRRLAPTDGSLDVLADRIAELKALFQKEYEGNTDQYDERDYVRFMDPQDDWHARRWIIYQREVPVAFEMLKDTMRWRKEMNLNGLSYEDFPREFYECGCTFEYGHDKKGKLTDVYMLYGYKKNVMFLNVSYNGLTNSRFLSMFYTLQVVVLCTSGAGCSSQ